MKKSIIFLLGIYLLIFAILPVSSDDRYIPGIHTSDSYVSQMLGFRFDCGDDFIMATDEEIKELLGVSFQETIPDEKKAEQFGELISEAQINYEALAVNPYTGANFMVMSEKTFQNMTLDQYINSSLQVEDSYEMPIMVLGRETIDFAGNTYEAVISNFENQGVIVQEIQMYKKIGNYVVIVQFSYTDESYLDNILEHIYVYD